MVGWCHNNSTTQLDASHDLYTSSAFTMVIMIPGLLNRQFNVALPPSTVHLDVLAVKCHGDTHLWV